VTESLKGNHRIQGSYITFEAAQALCTHLKAEALWETISDRQSATLANHLLGVEHTMTYGNHGSDGTEGIGIMDSGAFANGQHIHDDQYHELLQRNDSVEDSGGHESYLMTTQINIWNNGLHGSTAPEGLNFD
ncbi:hypothetical protein LTR53_017439, partial [Teratosphaeriaceae sp. CCFEE 6253]